LARMEGIDLSHYKPEFSNEGVIVKMPPRQLDLIISVVPKEVLAVIDV
jgi:hypothetical protein